MTSVTIMAVIDCDIETVWQIVTSLKDYSWRGDIAKIEVISEREFIEYTAKGYETTFKITDREELRYWAFDIENTSIHGHWSGVFASKDGKTEITFTEDITAKKWFMKPFVKGYLQKQQAQYVADLQRAVTQKK